MAIVSTLRKNVRSGAFHSDLTYVVEIPDKAMTMHSDALAEFISDIDRSRNIKKIGIESLKTLLLKICICEAKWVGTHRNSLVLNKVSIE